MEEVMKKVVVLLSAGMFAMVCGTAFSQTGKGASSSVPASDKAFVKEALAGGLAEVELGKLAGEKSSNAEVKKFGERMVQDHSKAGDELKALAMMKQIAVPSDLNAKDKALRDRLSRLSGAAFDRAYMQAMVSDHVNDVRAFKQEANAGKDADVKAFAAKTLPTLEDHLTMARNTVKEVAGVSPRQASR
jgi:putative membrane protein